LKNDPVTWSFSNFLSNHGCHTSSNVNFTVCICTCMELSRSLSVCLSQTLWEPTAATHYVWHVWMSYVTHITTAAKQCVVVCNICVTLLHNVWFYVWYASLQQTVCYYMCCMSDTCHWTKQCWLNTCHLTKQCLIIWVICLLYVSLQQTVCYYMCYTSYTCHLTKHVSLN